MTNPTPEAVAAALALVDADLLPDQFNAGRALAPFKLDINEHTLYAAARILAAEVRRLRSASSLLSPFFSAPFPNYASSMSDIVKSKLSEAAEKLGFRDGKSGVTIPPAEWSGDENELEPLLLRAWIRGWKSGSAVMREFSR